MCVCVGGWGGVGGRGGDMGGGGLGMKCVPSLSPAKLYVFEALVSSDR